MKNLYKTIFLTVAGFSIKIIFKSTKINYWSRLLHSEICIKYKPFIVNKTVSKIDYKINIYPHKFQHTYQVKGKNVNKTQNFILFYEEENKLIITQDHISIAQLRIILLQIIHKLVIKSKGFLLHTSSIIINRKVFLFLGKSGAGKSTASSLLNSKFRIFTDDLGIFKFENDIPILYQTPFVEKNEAIIKDQKGYHVAKIFLIKKSPYTAIKIIPRNSALIKKLATQLFVSNDLKEKQFKNLLAFMSVFDNFYLLSFTKKEKEMINLFRNIN